MSICADAEGGLNAHQFHIQKLDARSESDAELEDEASVESVDAASAFVCFCDMCSKEVTLVISRGKRYLSYFKARHLLSVAHVKNVQAYLDAIEGTSDNTGVDASAGRAVLARQAAIAEQTISRGQLHRDASGFERMPLEKTRLEVFVEGNPALKFVYRGIKAREVAGTNKQYWGCPDRRHKQRARRRQQRRLCDFRCHSHRA